MFVFLYGKGGVAVRCRVPGRWKKQMTRKVPLGEARFCMLPKVGLQFLLCQKRFHLAFGYAGAECLAAAGALETKANGAASFKLRETAWLAPFQVGRAKARIRILYNRCSVGWLHQVDPIRCINW